MRLLEPETKIWGFTPLEYQDGLEWVERAGRTCYQSRDKIAPGTAEKFVGGITRRGHLSVLEHSSLAVRMQATAGNVSRFTGRFFHSFTAGNGKLYVLGNWRTWYEWLVNTGQIKEGSMFPADIFHGRLGKDVEIVNFMARGFQMGRLTVEFLTDRAVLAELTRHRDDCSFSVESQRYCNYAKEGLSVIRPWFSGGAPNPIWATAMELAEDAYITLVKSGMKAEQARTVLPNSTAVRLVMSAYTPEWKHILKLRCSSAAYPPIRKLLEPVRDWLQ